MKQTRFPKILAIVTVLILLGGGAALFYYAIRDGAPAGASKNKEEEAKKPASAGFREAARESGITFRMNFLPNEQGEKFKINLYDHGCGVAVGDFDTDGFDDIYFVNQLGKNALYRNKGDGTFEDVTEKAGVGLGDRVCVGAAFADFDNDGKLDLYVTTTRGGNVLFRNMGDGTFKDITKEAGLTLIAHSQTATFFDFDNDGYLDLFVTNTAKWTLDYDPAAKYFAGMPDFWQMARAPHEFNKLYRNNGDGTFTDVTEKAGLQGKGWGGDVAVFDFNDDGYLDLLVTNMFGASQLYRNNRDGTFTDVTKETLGRTSWGAIGSKAFDFNNDGRLDLFIVDMHSDMWLPQFVAPDPNLGPPYDFKKKYASVMGPVESLGADGREAERKLNDLFKIRPNEVLFGNTFFKKLPDGKFAEISEQANLETFWPWGIAVGDFDNDGYEDLFLPSGMGHPYGYWPNALLMNNGDETFTDRATTTGIEPPPGGRYLDQKIGGKPAPKSSRCAAVADFDGDGRLDLVVNNFNDHPYYYRNEFPKKNYIAFRLTGAKSKDNPKGSNRDAVGALVWIHMGEEVMVRQVNPAGGYLSQSSQTLHFGLGDRQKVDRVDIRWPRGLQQKIENPEINKVHRVVEPKESGTTNGG